MLKVFDIKDGTLVEKQIIEMTDENYALATNGVNKLAFGGISKKVFLQTICINADNELQFDEFSLAM